MSLYLASVTLHVLAAVFWLGGMFFELDAGSKEHLRVRTLVARLGRLNAILGILVVYFATRLIRG